MSKKYTKMPIVIMFYFVVMAFFAPATSEAATISNKPGGYVIDERHTLYLTSFTLSHNRYTVTVPTTTKRTSDKQNNTISYVLQTPEGLRSSDGIATGLVFANKTSMSPKKPQPTTYTVMVLHQKSSKASRVNTLALTHVPFVLQTNTGAVTTALATHELAKLSVQDSSITSLPSSE
ncbi:MAG: hypothetical protein RLZZ70_546 [Candidatus Parcubacteria bacterium]|jgi:hypothetical protein